MAEAKHRLDAGRVATAILLLATAVLVALGVYTARQARMQAEAAQAVSHTHEVIEEIRNITFGIADAESAVRGYAVSPDASFVEELEPATERTRSAVARLRTLTADNPEQLARLGVLAPKVERRVAMLRDHMALLRSGPVDGLMIGAHALTVEIEGDTERMLVVERALLAARAADTRAQADANVLSAAMATGFGSLLILTTMVVLTRELRRRRAAEGQLSLLLDFVELLHACRTFDEALAIAATMLPRFFEGSAGAVSIVPPSRDLVETRVTWGVGAGNGGAFEPDACWALRRGQAHVFHGERGDVACAHPGAASAEASICQPLTAYGEVLGLLTVTSPSSLRAARSGVAAVAEQLALALANLQLREVLRNQSIRDPLTGLFNRRYTEETLARDLARATRDKTGLGVVMIDVDHFKRFNDTFGHDGGDAVLQQIASVMKAHTRAGDVASRMGGEELLVLLPGADVETTRQKAERLRELVEALRVEHEGRSLGQVTISVGVSAFPIHGVTAEKLIRTADKALYDAKHAGRNRVVVAAAT